MTDIVWFDDESSDISEMWDEDTWEDTDFSVQINSQFPGWYLVKMFNFNSKTLMDLEPWLQENVRYGKYQRVGWSSGCSYSVGVVFESGRDAMMFKLRWR